MQAIAGKPIRPDVAGAPTGQVGTIGVQIVNDDTGVVALARTTAGITEVPAGSGHYIAALTAPAVGGTYTILWDYGAGTPDTTAAEALYVVDAFDNRPQLDRLRRQLTGAEGIDDVDDEVLDELLDASIAWVEDVVGGGFNGRQITEVRDGNGTAELSLFHRPITSVSLVRVSLPVLALDRTYTASEVKVYALQGRIRIFTFKLAAEQATLYLDQQVNGNIFPTLPQCVTVTYTAGFPQYDPALDQTSLDGGVTWTPGDTRDPQLVMRLRQVQQAAVCDAAASYLAQLGALGVGTVTSVSFDGFSKALNPQAYGPQVEALVQRRDMLLERTKRKFILSSTG